MKNTREIVRLEFENLSKILIYGEVKSTFEKRRKLTKMNSMLQPVAGELAHIASIPPGIVEDDFDLNDDASSDNDDCENIEYVDATPSNSELVNLEEGE
ncbi:hypothetical protein Tco_0476876, partial [Tanacetum coccineum]